MKLILGPLAIILGQACASRDLPAPPAESLRTAIKTVSLRAETRRSEILVDTPVRGWLAGIPAGAYDVAKTLFDISKDPSADQAALLVVLTPLGLVVGAFYGPCVAFPPEVVARDERLLREILGRAGSGLEAGVEGRLETAIPGRRCREEADAVLSVELISVSLTGPFCLDPINQPGIRVRARLIRSMDGAELYAADFRHSGRARRFSGWAACPEDLQEYLDRALHELSEKIVDEVFLTVPPPRGPELK
jgi:hypothetical protein